jgi:lipopolysaccharide exporter
LREWRVIRIARSSLTCQFDAFFTQQVIPMTQFIAAQESASRVAGGYSRPAGNSKWSFARNIAVLGGGTALAQGFNVLLAPVLTRLYLPVSFGQYALFASFLNVATVAVSLRYELGIVAEPTEQRAAHLALAAFLFSLPTSLIGGGVLLLFIHFSLLGFNALPPYTAVLMAGALVFVAGFSVLRYWFVRQEQFGCVSQATVVQNTVRSVSHAAIGAIGGGVAGLLAGELLGRSAGMTRMFRTAWPKIKAHVFPIDRRKFSEVLRDDLQFPVYSLPSSVVDSTAANICIPLVVWYYGSSAGGYFALVQRILAVPLILISASVADAFQARLALYVRNTPDRIVLLFQKTSAGLMCVGVIPTALLMFYAGPAFRTVFGEKWIAAGSMAAIVAPFFLAQFVVSPLSRLVFVLDGQRLKLIYDVVALSGMIGVFAFSKWRHLPLMHALAILSAVGTFTFVVYYLLLMRIVSRYRSVAVPNSPQ